jgi:hypothetical protein
MDWVPAGRDATFAFDGVPVFPATISVFLSSQKVTYSILLAEFSRAVGLGVNEPLKAWIVNALYLAIHYSTLIIAASLFPDLPPNAQQMSNQYVNALMIFKFLF